MTCVDHNSKMKMYVTSIFFIIIGILFTIIGMILVLTWPSLFDYILHNQLSLTPGSKTFKMWQKNPIPLNLDFYFYNWTNANELKNPDVKPIFEQVGPYRFKEEKFKVNITWNSNDTVSFKQQRYWYFVPEESNGALEDVITTINVVAVTAAFQTRYEGYFTQQGLSLTLSAIADLTVDRSISQLLFEGYEDPLINMAKTMENLQHLEIPPYDKFGWFYERNGTRDFDGVFNMGTGEEDPTDFGVLKNWNFNSRTRFYKNECSMVNGSAGEFWPINPEPTEITLFSNDLCRSITYEYEKNVSVEGLNGYKFTAGDKLMDNGTMYPENKCFCNGECVPSGSVNASACRYGAPAFVSFPHFYNADLSYTNKIEGMHPQKKKHSFYITLEPKTGIPLDVAARLQINILLQPFEHVALFRNVPKLFIPVLWFEQKARISPDMANDLKQLLSIPEIGCYVNWGMLSFGLLILLIVILNFYINYKSEDKAEKMISRWGQNGTHRQMIKAGELPTANGLKSASIYTE